MIKVDIDQYITPAQLTESIEFLIENSTGKWKTKTPFDEYSKRCRIFDGTCNEWPQMIKNMKTQTVYQFGKYTKMLMYGTFWFQHDEDALLFKMII